MNIAKNNDLEVATLASGCFWCSEAIFLRLNGVLSVVSGYSGGETINPTYDQVCTGRTGHAEAIQIKFDHSIISFKTILQVFWNTHDPTTLNRQGNDIGTQYRSSIFYHNSEQKEIAEKTKAEINRSGVYSAPIVTEIMPFKNFYPAEKYHQNYYSNNETAPYCNYVITPKIKKLLKQYDKNIKNEYIVSDKW